MGETHTINVASQFSAYPIGRDEEDSPDTNGQKFREELLLPHLNAVRDNHGKVIVDFEGVESFGSSFLEEAFGGLVRKNGWTPNDLRRVLEIQYQWAGYARAARQAWHYIDISKPE